MTLETPYRLFILAFLVCTWRAAFAAGGIDELPVGQWYAFPDSRLDSVAPSPVPAGTNGVESVIQHWNSGVYDTDRDRLVVWGGGHLNYSGNEVYAFGPLTAENPAWHRLTDPSSPVALCVKHYPDGRPTSRHTYDLLDYMPSPYDKMVSYGIGSPYCGNGGGTEALDFYDFTVDGMAGEPWSRGATPSQGSGGSTMGFGGYNPVTNRLWYHKNESSNATLLQYNPGTDQWSTHATLSIYDYTTAAIDTKRNLMVAVTRRSGGQILVWDLNSPNTPAFVAQTSGSPNPMGAQAPGFVYDPVNDRFVAWSGGTTLYALSIPGNLQSGTWRWSVLPLDGGNTENPGNAVPEGTYGRFRYVQSLHAVVVVNAVDQPVFLRKLEGTPLPGSDGAMNGGVSDLPGLLALLAFLTWRSRSRIRELVS